MATGKYFFYVWGPSESLTAQQIYEQGKAAGRAEVRALVEARARHWDTLASTLRHTIQGASARACRDELHRILTEADHAEP